MGGPPRSAAPQNGYHGRVRSLGKHLNPAALIASLALAGALSPAAAQTAHAAPGDVSGSVTFGVTERRPDVPTGFSARITVATPAGETAPSQLKRLQITLPDGVGLGAQARTSSGDLQLCSPEAFAVGSALAAGCPAGSTIGAVQIIAGGQVLDGPVYVGAPSSSGLPSVYVQASEGAGSGLPGAFRVKLVGTLGVGGDGRLGIAFDQIPAPAFDSLELALTGGPGAVLGTPAACNAYAGLASMTSALTDVTFSTAATISIDQDCGLPGFSPNIEFWSDDRRAGASGASTVAVNRADRSPRLRSVVATLPSGFLADIGSVPECGLVGDAAAGCGGQSRVGSLELTTGVGPAPRAIAGDIFITPRLPGAVAGAHAVVRVRAGELDLGNLVVPIRVDLRPTDAGLTVSFDLPDRFRGVDLAIRRAAFRLDRPNFALNPSSCGPLGFGASFGSTQGTSAGSGGQLSYASCDALPFAPTLQATLTGETSPDGHPNVSVALNARPGDSNLRSANVVLPTGIAADLRNIQNQCPLESFNAVACSATTRVGTTTARVALTPEPIPGDVYLVRVPGESLPGLGLSFTGRFSQRVLSLVKTDQKTQRLVVRFDAIPDLPLRRLDMDIFGGAKGPIQLAPGICPEAAVWDATFGSHGPQVSSHTIPATCAPRPAKRSAITLSSTYGLSWRLTDLGGRSLQSAKLTLPAGFAIVKGRASRRQYQSVKLAGAVAKLGFTTKAVIVTASGKTTRTLAVKLKGGSIKRTGSVKKNAGARRVKLKIRLAFTDGSVQNQTITVRAK